MTKRLKSTDVNAWSLVHVLQPTKINLRQSLIGALVSVDENSNPRFATAAQHPPTSVGEEPAADLPAEGAASHPKLEGNELIEQLKRQLEYYFSK